MALVEGFSHLVIQVTNLDRSERELGRIRKSDRYDPRTIDLDIVVWGGEIMDEDVYEREFLRAAILEVCPGLNI